MHGDSNVWSTGERVGKELSSKIGKELKTGWEWRTEMCEGQTACMVTAMCRKRATAQR